MFQNLKGRFNYIKNLNSTVKVTLNKIRKQATDGEKIFAANDRWS